MRQIVLDTETTGLEPAQGHRIIEIGCVELTNRRLTGNTYHQYLQPDREIDPGAVEVHGITNQFLQDKPRFADIVDDFLAFVDGAELIIHNAPFDVAFLDNELAMLGELQGKVADRCTILDTLAMARQLHPGQRNSLDALCKRYAIDNSRRDLHGALLDAEILADVYLAMTGGQVTLSLDGDMAKGHADRGAIRPLNPGHPPLVVIRADGEELAAHESRLAAIAAASGSCLWTQLASDDKSGVD